MGFDVGLGRCAQGVVPKTLNASGAFPGLVLPDSILTHREAKAIHTRLIAFPGVAQASFACVPRQSDASQPLIEALLTLFEDYTIRMEYQAIISIRDDADLRIHVGDGFFYPMECHQGPPG
jgi:hypothetical protein